jgi:DNA-binding SARP family transcriptional activator
MDDVSLSVLGPVRVRVDGRDIPVGAPRPRTVLALLAAAAGRTVPAGTLIEQIWADRPPRRAGSTLQA